VIGLLNLNFIVLSILIKISNNIFHSSTLAHRGGGKTGPENTLQGFECGKTHGFQAVEFDVMLSSDGLPFLMHDELLDRTTSVKGNANSHTLAELILMEAAEWHGKEHKAWTGKMKMDMDINNNKNNKKSAISDEDLLSLPLPNEIQESGNIPDFITILDYCNHNNIWMNVEIKPSTGYEIQTGNVVIEYLIKYYKKELNELKSLMLLYKYIDIYNLISIKLPLISSFSYDSLLAASKYNSGLPLAYLIDDLTCKESSNWRQEMINIGACCLHTNHIFLTKELAYEIKLLGYGLFCYVVDTIEIYNKLKSWGVDSFCTDELNVFINETNIGLKKKKEQEQELAATASATAAMNINVDTNVDIDVDVNNKFNNQNKSLSMANVEATAAFLANTLLGEIAIKENEMIDRRVSRSGSVSTTSTTTSAGTISTFGAGTDGESTDGTIGIGVEEDKIQEGIPSSSQDTVLSPAEIP
jgi:glycerophosphoryl diester phosphodiesterase